MVPHCTAIPVQVDGTRQLEIDDTLLVCAPDCADAVSLNSSAREVWELCDGQRTVEEVSVELGHRYDCPPEAFLQDVSKAVDQLVSLQLVHLSQQGIGAAEDS